MTHKEPTAPGDDQLLEQVRQCFNDTEMENDFDPELTLFDTEETIKRLVSLVEQSVREALEQVQRDDVNRLRNVYMTHDDVMTEEYWLAVRKQLRKEISDDIDKRIKTLQSKEKTDEDHGIHLDIQQNEFNRAKTTPNSEENT